MQPYFIKTAFQPQFELDDAKKLCAQLGVRLRVLELDALKSPGVAANPADRCYFCKTALFGALTEAARQDGYTLLLDGTNASDDAGDRPGMRALRKLHVRSPLRECGLTKREIRELSRQAGLFTWDKPAYACLATRIPTGEEITEEKLKKTEQAEAFLFSLGLTDFRVRSFAGAARIQVPEAQLPLLLAHRAEVLQALGVDAIGVNCSTGPDQLESVVRALHEMTDLPIVAKPNAGMPKILETGEAVYSMQADTFAAHMGQLVEAGASLIGGCCGTTPEYIGALRGLKR